MKRRNRGWQGEGNRPGNFENGELELISETWIKKSRGKGIGSTTSTTESDKNVLSLRLNSTPPLDFIMLFNKC